MAPTLPRLPCGGEVYDGESNVALEGAKAGDLDTMDWTAKTRTSCHAPNLPHASHVGERARAAHSQGWGTLANRMGRRNKEAKGSMLLPHAASQLQLSTVRGTVVPLCVCRSSSPMSACVRVFHQMSYARHCRFYVPAWPIIKSDIILAFKDLSSLDYRSFYLLHDTLLTLLPKKLTRDLLGTITP
jgi:hypothetical protein